MDIALDVKDSNAPAYFTEKKKKQNFLNEEEEKR